MLLRKLYYYNQIRKNHSANVELLREKQFQLLYNIVDHAYRNVPIYRRVFDEEGFRPEDLTSWADVKKIPLLERDEIKKGFPEDVTAEDVPLNDYYSRSTSGSSSGNPLTVVWDEQSWDYSEAIYLRSLRDAGYKPWKPLAYYWWEEFDDDLYNRFFMRKDLIHKDLSIEEQWERLKELDPSYIYYFASSIYVLAKYVDNIGEADAISPESIITHAEILTPGMRDVIEDVFGCKVYDHYGSTEFNRMAGECGEGNYHLDIDGVYFEFPEWREFNEVIATNLINYKMPLIRYRMEDIVELGECDCQSSLPALKSILGRKKDFFDFNGEKIPPNILIDAVSGNRDVLEFRITQNSETVFTVKYRPNVGVGPEVESELEGALRSKIEEYVDDVEVLFERGVPSKTRNGKMPLIG